MSSPELVPPGGAAPPAAGSSAVNADCPSLPRLLGASERAQTIAALVPALPAETAQELRRLVSHHIAAPSPARLREARLGLLAELVSEGSGQVPLTDQYEQLRATRARKGEEWPHHTTLCRLYGHWLAAVKAAMRLHFQGGRARVASSHHHCAGTRPPYTRDEITHAIERFEREHGDWPTKWEFEEWRGLARRLARERGTPEPRIPSMKQVRRLFGTYQRALEVARLAAYEAGKAAGERVGAREAKPERR